MIPCTECGKEHKSYIAVDDKGTQISPSPTVFLCEQCQDKKDTKLADEARIQELEKIRKAQGKTWQIECNLQGIFAEKRFSNFNSKLQPIAFKLLKEWDFGKSLVLSSPDNYGVGKTHLVCALVNRLIENEMTADIIGDINKYIHKYNCPVYFTSEIKIMARIRTTFDNGEKIEREDDIYKQLCKVPLLIIDDVGKVRPRDYSFLQGVYFRIIDERYANEKDMIITTNLNYPDLETHIGGACADRLREMCGKDGLIKMVGQSYRRDNGKR